MGCNQCGDCCRWTGHVHLTDSDIKRISGFLNIDERDFINDYTCLTATRSGLSLINQPDESCIFLEYSSCRIYPVRPKQCRDYPHIWTVADMGNCGFNKS